MVMDNNAAIEILAHHVVRHCVTAAFATHAVGWEDYPDVGELTWLLVAMRATQLAREKFPDTTAFMDAYQQLAAGADGEA